VIEWRSVESLLWVESSRSQTRFLGELSGGSCIAGSNKAFTLPFATLKL
jgi:hypothetical protein